MTGARDTLRSATRAMHDRVDAVYSTFRLDEPASYGAFLQAQAAAHIPCEAALDRAHAERIVPDWPARRRAALLHADLARMGLPMPALGAEPVFRNDAAILGAVYVLEGSRLGGAMLVRAVPENMPRGFLGAQVPGAWRGLMQVIDARLQADEDVEDAVTAARDVFVLFEQAGRTPTKVA